MRKFTFLLAISLGFSLAGLRAQHLLSYIDTLYPGADTTFILEEAFTELDTSSYLTTGFLWDRTSPAPARVPSRGLFLTCSYFYR